MEEMRNTIKDNHVIEETSNGPGGNRKRDQYEILIQSDQERVKFYQLLLSIYVYMQK